MSEYITTKKLAKDWGVSKSHMSDLMKRYKADGGWAVPDGRLTIVKESEVIEWLKSKQ